MKKRNFFVLALSAMIVSGGLVACNETPTDEPPVTDGDEETPPPVKLEASIDLAIDGLKDLMETDILSYTYYERMYQDNYYTGEVYTNYELTMDLNSYDGEFEGTSTETQLTGILEVEKGDSVSGTMTSYKLDDNSFVVAIIADDEESQSSVEIR